MKLFGILCLNNKSTIVHARISLEIWNKIYRILCTTWMICSVCKIIADLVYAETTFTTFESIQIRKGIQNRCRLPGKANQEHFSMEIFLSFFFSTLQIFPSTTIEKKEIFKIETSCYSFPNFFYILESILSFQWLVK